jgi:Tfp pilus assembly protein PilO
VRTLQDQIGWCARAQWVLAGATVLLAGGFYLGGYRPAARELARLDGQIAAAERELESNQARTQIRPIVEQKVNESRRKLERFDQRLPRQQDLGQFIGDITHLSQRSALRRWSTQTHVPRPSDDRLLSELPIELHFEGEFPGVFAFLRQMEQMPRLTRVRDLQVKSKPNTPGEVEVQVSLAIYYSEG